MTDRTYVAETVLGSAVANAGTFTVGYPTGTSQGSFSAGLAASGSYMIVNKNDKWTAAAGQMSLVFGASSITVTNSTGQTLPAGASVSVSLDAQDGNDVVFLSIPVFLAAITAAADVVTAISPGIAGVVEYWEFAVTQPVTTAAKLATLGLAIGATNVTGGAIALTSAAATPLGKVIPGAAITALNVLTPASTLSIKATAVTAFAEGSGFVNIRIRKTPSYA